jgi:hypothetical protein
MSNLEAASVRLTFDDVLEAVQESKRGRWFLQEYENRLQQRDSKTIVSAIERLETRMQNLATPGVASEELTRVKAAIANAREDLLKLGLGKEVFSDEARLFANLADLARKAMPIAVDSNAGIVRSLQLVDEIDRTISHGPSDRGAKFFVADSALFEKSPAPSKPILVATPEQEVPQPTSAPQTGEIKKSRVAEPIATGAKLVFVKAPSQIETNPETAHAIEVQPTPAKEEIKIEQGDLPSVESPRIVITRRKPEDMPNVIVDEPTAESSAA